jgi:RNA polymerase sigma factor (sigma-70 family)
MQTTAGKEAFLTLITENRGIIIKICGSYCRNPGDREDLAQEIIYHLWKSMPAYNHAHKFSTWMYRVALNVAISFYRTGKKQLHPPLETAHFNIAGDTGSPAAETDAERLWQCIARLNDFDKALMLLWLDEKTYRETAEILGISETNVATRLSRIREKIKQQLVSPKHNDHGR